MLSDVGDAMDACFLACARRRSGVEGDEMGVGMDASDKEGERGEAKEGGLLGLLFCLALG